MSNLRIINLPRPRGGVLSTSFYLSILRTIQQRYQHCQLVIGGNEPSGEIQTNSLRTSMANLFNNNSVQLYVCGLNKMMQEVDLYNFFVEEAGVTPISVKICRNISTRESFGYGFANFEGYEDATKAIDKLNLTIYMGKMMKIMWSFRKVEALRSSVGKLFLQNLAPSIGESRLYQIFARHGKVICVGVIRRYNRSSLGYGYVQFESQELADFAIKALHNTIIDGKIMSVAHYVNKSKRCQIDLLHIASGPLSRIVNQN